MLAGSAGERDESPALVGAEVKSVLGDAGVGWEGKRRDTVEARRRPVDPLVVAVLR